MKLLYTNESAFLVNNAKNIVEQTGIQVVLKNEFAAGAAGDLAPLDTWLELWIVNDVDYLKAEQAIKQAAQNTLTHDWFCRHCHEKNDASFEICWQCQHEYTE